MDSGSSLIGKWQNMKIDFVENATLKLLDGTTSYTLHQPWAQITFGTTIGLAVLIFVGFNGYFYLRPADNRHVDL